MKSDVEQGSTFADSLRKHPKPFDDLYVNLVHAGEVGGILDTILNRLAVYLEKADALARKVKGPASMSARVVSKTAGAICEATKRFQISVYSRSSSRPLTATPMPEWPRCRRVPG